MGREVRRVPLDFDGPLDTVWHGFIRPESLDMPNCVDCGGNGSTTARRWVAATAHMLLMLDDDLRDQERGRPMHPYFNSYYTTAYGTRPSPDIRELGTGLAGREASFLGHDAIDGWTAANKIIAAAGLDPDAWGRCAICGGSGEGPETYEGQRADRDAWEPTDPPTGEGWQLWETVSEGSPISPVFDSAEDLARWMSSPAYTRATSPLTFDTALQFVNDGWAPSFVASPATGVISGEQWIGDRS